MLGQQRKPAGTGGFSKLRSLLRGLRRLKPDRKSKVFIFSLQRIGHSHRQGIFQLSQSENLRLQRCNSTRVLIRCLGKSRQLLLQTEILRRVR